MIVTDQAKIRCVGAIVHDSAGRLLLVSRANPPGQGQWSLPGGRVEPGESDSAALRREVREETGLSVIVGPLIGSVSRPAAHGVYEIFDYSCQTRQTALFPGDDAVDAAWLDGATFATLDRQNALTEGLARTLRSWRCLPRNE